MRLCVCRHVRISLFKQQTAYEMRISDTSSAVCSSDLGCSRETVGMNACGFDVSRPEAGGNLAPGVHIHEAAFVPVAYFGVMDVGTRTAGSSGVSMGRHLRSGERVHLRAARRDRKSVV